MKSQVRGGTRWKRFAVVMVPSVAATAAIGVGLAQGALAASFSISGQEFKVKADSLVGTNFVQYGSVDSRQGPRGQGLRRPGGGVRLLRGLDHQHVPVGRDAEGAVHR